MAWLEHELTVKKSKITELDASDRLDAFRAEQDLFVEPSFPAIIGISSNGAVIHYRPKKEDAKELNDQEVILVDSGGQYWDGTTDITRTFHYGIPTEEERRAFTLVLKGHIAIDAAVFPNTATGGRLDSLARQFLWANGMDYLHGTGHGVGHFLNVHEGPQGISIGSDSVVLKPGMTVSNEPGYYKDGCFGIRLEDVIAVVESPFPNFLAFDNFTRAPFQLRMIDVSLLTEQERAWINRYHEACLKDLMPFMHNDPLATQWLIRETQPI